MHCSHCRLEFKKEQLFLCVIDGVEHYFCCYGCEQVYKILHSEGLDDFYIKINNSALAPVKLSDNEDVGRFDADSFTKRYVKVNGAYNEIALIIEHVHCAACIWLNEKMLSRQHGIIKASLNYTNNKAVILFDSNIIKLSDIILLIRSIGYDAYPYDPLLQEQYAHKEHKEYYTKMIVAVFCTMNIMWIAVAQYAGYFSGISSDMKFILAIASLCLCIPALFYSGSIFWRSAYFSLKNGSLGMDSLVISGSSIAFIYSLYATFVGEETYFESITMIITFVLIGKFLERRGKKMAVDSLDRLYASIPVQIRVIRNNEKIFVAPEEVNIGESVEVLPAEKVALDGILQSDYALCDESSLNGESLPIYKKKNDIIYSGSIILEAPIIYTVTHDSSSSLIHTIINLVEESLQKKPKIQEQANYISGYFSASVLCLAFLSFFVWAFVFDASIQRAIEIAVSVIIIACPCALALATPIASVVGLGRAIEKKILFKEARLLESIAKATTIIFDKTGTLTHGALQVIQCHGLDNLNKAELQILFTLVSQNNHPISKSVKEFLKKYNADITETTLNNVEQIQGQGIIGSFDKLYLGGSLTLLKAYHIPFSDNLNLNEKILFCFASQNELLAYFLLEDILKEDAKENIHILKSMGLDIMMASGDRLAPVKKIAHTLNIDIFYAEQTPLDKANLIKELHESKKVVIMVGDGINDTIALAQSDIAIAMGSGVDTALDMSDIVLLDNKLSSLQQSITIGQDTFRLIKQNILIALFYNATTIPLAMLGFVIPIVAAASMSISSLIVVGNSLRNKNKN